MSEKRTVRELFVIHRSGVPIAHVGTGHVEIDDALFGGLLSAIENVGLSLGLEDDGALDTISFRAYELVYTRTKNGLIVLLTSPESAEFFVKVKEELREIGFELEMRGFLDDTTIQAGRILPEASSIVARKAISIFARQNDVFIWDEQHTFQLAEHQNERWNGNNLFSNYFMLSPMRKALSIPMEDTVRLCELLLEKKRPSELLDDLKLQTKDEKRIEDTIRFLHMYGLVTCFGTTIVP